MNHWRALTTSTLLAVFCIIAGVVNGQELRTTSKYEITEISTNGMLAVIDPMFEQEELAPSKYKVDRRFRVELIYNRKNRTDRIGGINWRLTVSLEQVVTSETKTLVIENAQDAPGIFSAWGDFNVNSEESEWKITEITPEKYDGVSSSWVTASMSELPQEDIHIECMVFNDRIVELDDSACAAMSLNGEKLSWQYVEGAVEYDVEWVFVDDLDNFSYGSPEDPFEFKEPVRITTFKHEYRIDRIYPAGKLYFRIRPRGYFFAANDQEVYYYGDWCYQKKNGSGNMIETISNHYEAEKNWQYSVAFVENGMSVSSVSYMDGTLRGRQSLTRMRSNGQVVAAGSVYDYEGRQTVQVIPTPVSGGSLGYYNDLHQDISGGPFDKADFDQGVSQAMGTGSGAGKYFSPSNDFSTTIEPFRDRIPDAQGYTYTQTIFHNDNTGRPIKSSGVGYEHRMGGGRETHYYYAKPTERELRELFGSNVGDVLHYQKVVTVDPNGQASVAYVDQLGRTVASGLLGGAPGNLVELDNNPDNAPVTIVASLDNQNVITQDANNNNQSVIDYYHINIGSNNFTLDYDFNAGAVNDVEQWGTLCSSCFYELEIHVYDPTGAEVDLNYLSETDQNTYPFVYEKYSADQLNCGNSTFSSSPASISSTFLMEKTGTYHIQKTLRLDEESLVEYINNNISSLTTAPNLQTMIDNAIAQVDTTVCGFDCNAYYTSECMAELGFVIGDNLSVAQLQSLQDCIDQKCESGILEIQNDIDSEGGVCNLMLEMLKTDVSPGGWVFEEDTDWQGTSSNWTFTFNTLAGGTFTPTSLEDLEDNWEDGWQDQLVSSHPEYCQYLKCVALDNLMEYQNTLYGVTSWSDAISNGYIHATTYDFLQNSDPLFSNVNYPNASTWLSDLNQDYQDTNDNIHAFVTGTLFVNNPSLIEDDNGVPLTGAAYDNVLWDVMLSIYLGERYHYIESEYASCEYYDHPSANFIDLEELENSENTFPEFLSPLNESCPEVCNNNVQYWLSRIDEECDGLTQSQLDEISTHLQSYCLTDCDGIFNVTGAIQLSDLVSSPINGDLFAADSIINSVCSGFSIEHFAEVDTCSNPVLDTMVNVNLYSPIMQAELAMLTSIDQNSYGFFMNSPRMDTVANVGTRFTQAHWDNYMEVNFIHSTTTSTFLVNEIQSIDIIGHSVDTTSGSISFDVNVIETNGNSTTVQMSKFSLLESDRSTWMNFVVDRIYTKQDVIGELCDSLGTPFDYAFDYQAWVDDCIDQLQAYAIIHAENDYEDLMNELFSDLYLSYSENCFSGDLNEHMSIEYKKQQYAFTLYYYDQAGSLVQTVPPQGCHIVGPGGFDSDGNWDAITEPQHKMKTMYTYNSLGQMIKSQTPDGGEARFYYNSAQQMRFSQNAHQAANDEYSYSRYDEFGRPIEVGVTEVTNFTAYYDAVKDDNSFPQATVANPNSEVVRTYYEEQPLDLELIVGWSPKDLNTRIAAVAYYNNFTGDQDAYSSAIYYDYDIHGNVQELLTDNPAMGHGQRYKTVAYEYDLYSGKVLEVAYQKNQQDQFLHRYQYDDDNRILSVETSRDGISWDTDAEYFYFLTGALARTELGDSKVQGIDYAYTKHGWLKGVNSNTLEARRDMGADGASMNKENKWVARDVFGFSLTYYSEDYTPIVNQTVSDNKWFAENEAAFMPTSGADLYNGNIRAMVTAISDDNNQAIDVYAKVYQYDQLQRIKEAKTYYSSNLIANNSWAGGSFTDAYYSSYKFDLNGNLTELVRNGSGNGGSAYAMDNFKYHYEDGASGTTTLPTDVNKLYSVEDLVSSDPYTNDIDATQSSASPNYVYDEIGRLIKDIDEQIDEITWTVTNKVAYIKRDVGSQLSDVAFKYNAMGNRIAKIEYPKNASGDIISGDIVSTYYALDAQGNVMATYEQIGQTPVSTELLDHNLYGSSRLGVQQVNENIGGVPNFDYCSYDNRAAAIVSISPTTFSNGQTIQYKVGSRSLNTPVTWGSNIQANIANLLNAINDESVNSAVVADVWYSDNTAGHYYLQLKYMQPGNWQGQSLQLYINGTATTVSAHVQRTLGYGDCSGQDIVGEKRFELSNHLGNVLAVISDRKWAVDDGTYNSVTGVKTASVPDNTVDYYIASVVSWSDYYPYGMQMDGRHGQSESYRYGFQGQERDDEVKGEGNSINYKYRMHDPRIGRFFAVDPLSPKYPHYTPYQFSGNKVIHAIELEGLEEIMLEKIWDANNLKPLPKLTNGNAASNQISLWNRFIDFFEAMDDLARSIEGDGDKLKYGIMVWGEGSGGFVVKDKADKIIASIDFKELNEITGFIINNYGKNPKDFFIARYKDRMTNGTASKLQKLLSDEEFYKRVDAGVKLYKKIDEMINNPNASEDILKKVLEHPFYEIEEFIENFDGNIVTVDESALEEFFSDAAVPTYKVHIFSSNQSGYTSRGYAEYKTLEELEKAHPNAVKQSEENEYLYQENQN